MTTILRYDAPNGGHVYIGYYCIAGTPAARREWGLWEYTSDPVSAWRFTPAGARQVCRQAARDGYTLQPLPAPAAPWIKLPYQDGAPARQAGRQRARAAGGGCQAGRRRGPVLRP
jgi:hypothetical protein